MKHIIGVLTCLVGVGFGAMSKPGESSESAPASDRQIREATTTSERFSAREISAYNKIQRQPGVSRAKMIRLGDGSLSNSQVEIPLFLGAKAAFKVNRDLKEPIWEGKGKNSDRFVIRESDGRFSGQILFGGRQYVLSPIKENVSTLVEVGQNGFACGSELRGQQ
jgi:hypothetical protein